MVTYKCNVTKNSLTIAMTMFEGLQDYKKLHVTIRRLKRLRHEDIINRLTSSSLLREGCGELTGKIYKGTLQDYISMCFVCGMTEAEVYDMVKCNSEIPHHIIKSNIKLFLSEEYKERPVKVDGKRYDSISDASDQIGVHPNTIKEWLKVGKAVYY